MNIGVNYESEMVSIIIPTLNSEKHLKECIDSILAQSYKNFEAIFVDGGSKDTTVTMLKTVALEDDRIKIYEEKCWGPAENRFIGFNNSKGKFVCFVDSDDILDKFAIEILINTMLTENVSVAIGDYDEFFVSEKITYKDNTDCAKFIYEGYHEISEKIYVMLWGKLYKREVIEKINPGQYRQQLPFWFFEDSFLTPLIMDEVKIVAKTCHKVYYYRQNEASMSRGANFSKHHLEIYQAKKFILKVLKKNNYVEDYRAALREYGNCLIKEYMAVGSSPLFSDNEKSRIYSELVSEYQASYKTLMLDGVFSSSMKISFQLFHISPGLWKMLLGWYYKKNYMNLTKG